MLALIITTALAQTATGPFVGDLSENFDSFSEYQAKPLVVFGGSGFLNQGLPGNAEVRALDPVSSPNSFNIDDVLDGCCGTSAQDGPEICFQFLEDMVAFGGQFRHLYTTNIVFRDGSGVIVGTTSIENPSAPIPPYSWEGWSVDPFRSVCFYNEYSLIRMDDLQVSMLSAPTPPTQSGDTGISDDSGTQDTGTSSPQNTADTGTAPAAVPTAAPPFRFFKELGGPVRWLWR